jgi:hypothetical protein
MENQLIQLYLFVCQIYDTHSESCFQRLSNNREPIFTDQEIVTIYLFGHLNQMFQKKQIHQFIERYWLDYFPRLPVYQTFVARLNQMEQTFQTIGQVLSARLQESLTPEFDHLIDSFPVMLASKGHAYTARVAHDIANLGYCASKKTYFHGVRLHCIAQKRFRQIPLPTQIWLCEASHHDLKAVQEQQIELPETTLFGDLAYPEPIFREHLHQQHTGLQTPVKKPKGKDLSKIEKYQNRLISKFRQPIESFFNWLNEKTNMQKASKVRSSDALMIHCWGKLSFAFFLLVFNP